MIRHVSRHSTHSEATKWSEVKSTTENGGGPARVHAAGKPNALQPAETDQGLRQRRGRRHDQAPGTVRARRQGTQPFRARAPGARRQPCNQARANDPNNKREAQHGDRGATRALPERQRRQARARQGESSQDVRRGQNRSSRRSKRKHRRGGVRERPLPRRSRPGA